MYYSRLSALQEIIPNEQIKKVDDYFNNLIGNAVSNITVSKLANSIEIPYETASSILIKCKELGLLKSYYVGRCPECGMPIKTADSISELPDETFECYNCGEEIIITPSEIEIFYSLVDESVFTDGQQIKESLSARTVVPENTLKSAFLAGGVNKILFQPTDEEYDELLQMYRKVKLKSGTTKKKGDRLEDFVIKLFNFCQIFRAAGIRTTENQIDCCVRNKTFLPYGILKTVGGYFYIECKNEDQTPSGGYLSKLESIMSLANAGGKDEKVKFGIIISKRQGPKTFRQLANKHYLAKGITIISISGKELENLCKNKENLLELIERKAFEVQTDATTDLVDTGLFEA